MPESLTRDDLLLLLIEARRLCVRSTCSSEKTRKWHRAVDEAVAGHEKDDPEMRYDSQTQTKAREFLRKICFGTVGR